MVKEISFQFAGLGARDLVDGDDMLWPPIAGEQLVARLTGKVYIATFENEGHGLTEPLVGLPRHDIGHADAPIEKPLDLLGLDFYSTGADDIVRPADDAELTGAVGSGRHFGYVVGCQRLGAYGRRRDDETAATVERDIDTLEGRVPIAGIGTTEASEGDVGERLGHAVCAPYGVGHRAEDFRQALVDSPAADNDIGDLAEETLLARHSHGLPCLHWRDGGKIGNLGKRG